MDLDRFELEGFTYYQQGRKCGKSSCRCNDGHLHGPYWYRRDKTSGKISYVGKELPEGVAGARLALDVQRADIQATIWALNDRARSLQKLAWGEKLGRQDRANVEDLGFGQCLVHSVSSASIQDQAEKPLV